MRRGVTPPTGVFGTADERCSVTPEVAGSSPVAPVRRSGARAPARRVPGACATNSSVPEGRNRGARGFDQHDVSTDHLPRAHRCGGNSATTGHHEPSRLVLQASAPDLRALWAVGVGNEQDLTSTNRNAQGTSTLSGHGRTAGENYRADWNAVEPVLVKLAPHAIRVYDEFSRWTFIANEQSSRQARPP